MRNIIIYFAIKYKGDFNLIYKALKNKEIVPIEEIKNIHDQNHNAITIIDSDYPEELKFINKPPFVLFYKGNKTILRKNKMALTGEYNNSKINKFLDQNLDEIWKNNILVTNFYKGLDEKIVEKYDKNNKEIIFISANGINNPYFAQKIQNIRNKLIISEYPDNVNINKKRLIERNRLVSGLSRALIIFSSKKESGIMNLVSSFLENGKDIFCFPGNDDSDDGNSFLISEGATLITEIKDLTTIKNKTYYN
ncbi:MAG: DNA-processing protein DprA [Metamycoplasmataceae bacterium]